GLQPHARDEHRRYQTVPRGNPGLRGVSRCARRVTVQVAQHGLRLRRIDSRLDTAKYAQTVTSTWTTPIRCSFWGDERRFHTAWVKSVVLAVRRSLPVLSRERTSTALGHLKRIPVILKHSLRERNSW